MHKIKYIEHITNEEVLTRMTKEKEVMMSVKTKNNETPRPIMRNPEKYEILHTILRRKILRGRRPKLKTGWEISNPGTI